MDEEIQTTGENSAGSPAAPSGEWSPQNLNAETVRAAFAEADAEEIPVAAASGSETPADPETPAETPTEPALVPSHRLREETEKRRELEERFNPWAPAIEALSQQGYTPEQIQGMLTQAAEAPAPAQPALQETAVTPDLQEEFHAYLTSKGADPFALAAEHPDTYDLRYEQFEMRREIEQQKTAVAQERQAQETALRVQRWESDVQAVQGKYPDLLGDDQAKHDLVAAYIARHGIEPNRAQFEQHVGRWSQSIEALRERDRQVYAAAKAGDALVPSVAGGSSPPPVTRPDYHSLKPGEQEAAMVAQTRALLATGG